MTIYLDVDGVLVDTHAAMLRVHGREDLLESASGWPPGVYDLAHVLRVSPREFWRPIESLGADFWRNLVPTPWARKLYDDLCEIVGEAHVVFCTKPTTDPASASGKLAWIQDFTNDRWTMNYILTGEKSRLARSPEGGKWTLLIDDRPENCAEFEHEGGLALQFPARWQGCNVETIIAIASWLPKVVEDFAEREVARG